MKKVLLIGTSFSAVPIYFALKRRGFHVTVCGGVKTDPCHQYADASIFVDYSDPEALLNAVKEVDFQYIVPSCNDYSYLSASHVANKLGYPGYDTTEITAILHTKKLFREKAAKFGLKAPKVITDLGNLKWEHLPCLIKPVDSFSGRGVTKVESIAEISAAIDVAKKVSRSGEVVIEQFIQGSLHSHSAFISKGEVIADFFVDEFCTTYPYQVNCSNYPSVIPKTIQLGVRLEIERLAKELRITDGLLHTQFMSDQNDFWIIECMRRCPGDLYGSLIERSTGVDYADMFIRPFVEISYSNETTRSHEYYYGRHTVSSRESVVNFSFSPKLKGVELEIVQLKESGEKLEPAPFDKMAIVLIKFTDFETMVLVTPKLADYFQINSLEKNYLMCEK
jgi:biotin carboxylase